MRADPSAAAAPLAVAQPRRIGAGGKPLRVCHVAYTFYERDNRVRRYAEALAERGHEVDVIALRRDGQPSRADINGVSVCGLQRRNVTENAAATYLAKILMFFARASAVISARHARRRYDVVHVHNMPDFLVFASWLPRLTGSRVILDIHDILPELYSDKFQKATSSWTFRGLRWIEQRSAHFAHHVIVAEDLWREKLVRRARLRPERCTTLLNYPDRRLFKPLLESERPTDGKFIVLYPGTLNHHQGVDIAVNAFALARPRMPNAELHIYGEGPARRHIAALIEDLGLGGVVKLNAPVPIEAIAGVMAKADLGVIPKRADGFGNEAFSTKSLEFMSCGIPVVMARTEVDARHFDDSLVRFFHPGAAEALAHALVQDYENRTDRLARAQRAVTFVAQMDWTAKLPSYLHIVEGGQVAFT